MVAGVQASFTIFSLIVRTMNRGDEYLGRRVHESELKVATAFNAYSSFMNFSFVSINADKNPGKGNEGILRTIY